MDFGKLYIAFEWVTNHCLVLLDGSVKFEFHLIVQLLHLVLDLLRYLSGLGLSVLIGDHGFDVKHSWCGWRWHEVGLD